MNETDTKAGDHIPLEGLGSPTCPSCQSPLAGKTTFILRAKEGLLRKCARCSLLDRALFRRSATVAVFVGTALVTLNQGDKLLSGTFPWESSWYKIPLTYMVPFLVATYGALANACVRPESPAEPD